MGRHAALLLGGQLEAAQQIERVLDGEVVVLSGKTRGAVDLVQFAHLELGAVRTGCNRGIDQRDGAIEIAIMVVADFGDDKTWMIISDRAVGNLQRPFQILFIHCAGAPSFCNAWRFIA